MNEKIVVDSTDYLLTESMIDKKISLDQLVGYLKTRKTTGELKIHLNQGGIRQIVISERTEASNGQSEKIRTALGMD